jgi:hypothetical protein
VRNPTLIAKKREVRAKPSKRDQIDGSGLNSSSKPSKVSVPQSLASFLELANCVPPLARQMFLASELAFAVWDNAVRCSPPREQAYEWLRTSPIGHLLPPKEEALERRGYTPERVELRRANSFFAQAEREKPEPRHLEFQNWCNAVRFTIKVLEVLIEINELEGLFDFSEPPPRRSTIPWSPPWGGRVLRLDSQRRVEFVPLKHPLSEFYNNFERALTGLDVTRLKRCSAELRGGVKCDRFFLVKRTGKRISRACSPRHGALIRQKKWLAR